MRECSSQTANLSRGGDRWPQPDPIQLPIRAVDENVTVDSELGADCAEPFEISSAFGKPREAIETFVPFEWVWRAMEDYSREG